ncbi:MAG TPA: serine hydrolase domain-containing protein, partial [Chloroflexota bacterium]|nr:serine hydrolase domain-containing protein [Chloroflexota bacterium]
GGPGAGPPAAHRATFDMLARHTGGQLELRRLLESTAEHLAALLQSPLTEQWLRLEIDGPAGIRLQPSAPPAEERTGEPLSDEAIARELERYLHRLVEADVFSGAVLVARDGVPLFTAAHGLADQTAGEPNRLSTRFNIASMGKMFTAVAVAQLAEQGRPAFVDTLASVLPDYPNRAVAEQITIHHLLTHTSGLGEFFGPRYQQMRDELGNLSDYLQLFADAPLAFPPGTSWSYSNAGYIVLGTVIERLAGQDYYDYVRTHIYQPAGMTRSDAFERDASLPDLAIGYAIIPNPTEGLRPEMASQPRSENTPWLGHKGTSAGGSYATVEDLLAFAGALRAHRLLSPQTTDLMVASKVESTLATAEGYGYGFVVSSLHGARIVGHGGSGPGVSTNLDLFLDHGLTAVVLSNYDGISPTASAAGPVLHKIRSMVVRA